MTLFTDTAPDPVSRSRRGWIGWLLLFGTILAIVLIAVMPAPYVIEQPGPVFDTLGEVTIEEELMPLIQIPDQETFPTEGSLDMLTVNLRGNPEALPNWIDIIYAYFDPSQAVVPVEVVYPTGVTVEESTEQARVDMENSQKEAIAAALTELGHDIPSTLMIVEAVKNGPSDGVLLPDDVVVSVNGTSPTDVTALRELIAQNGVATAADVVVLRAGAEKALTVTPQLSAGEGSPAALGILVESEYKFPFTVTIQLENVGGPSAGMMFSLGIIDKLIPGALNGGEHVAGTGTISSTGDVGPIGGIVQKMWGAKNAGAQWFLAPVENCDEVAGNVPAGLTVVSVDTLDDSLNALEAISSGGTTADLPMCSTGSA